MKTENNISKEKICIKGGLGPIRNSKETELDILPVTVFIGPQGTGKSLVSQLIYFFRDAEYLMAQYSGESGSSPGIHNVVNGIRDRADGDLSSFLTTSHADIQYTCENRQIKGSSLLQRSISINRENQKITPGQPFAEEIDNWQNRWISDPSSAGKALSTSLFIPAERTYISRFISSAPRIIFGNRALPSTATEFAEILFKADDTHLLWQEQPSLRPAEADDIENIMGNALMGKALPSQKSQYTRKWQWLPKDSPQPVGIGMASSGQMSAWPLVFIAQAVLSWKKEEQPLFLHIEEPEAHLHPGAQAAIVKLLTYLANHGIHIIVTTHSLAVLYAFNNLTLAYRQLGNKTADRVPEIPIRLPPENMAAYLFADGKVENIADESGQIDEGLLGQVLGDLEVEFNRLTTYKVLWE